MITRGLFNLPGSPWRTHFDELNRMRRQLDTMFNRYEGGSPATRAAAAAGVFPLVNLTEDNDAYYLRAELPGIAAGDLSIESTDNNIAISGERKIPEAAQNARYHRREREAGRFSRVIALPCRINRDKIEARLSDGMLTVTVPKAEEEKPRKININ
jgi:HSP20 family protein